ncbi:hypothetical protein HIM_02885 [Hirsutella minnesotensis 3608]|nr:hypothetical protein HIM_02885 [Hirsutella minnesotensis 3608]
MPGPSHPSVEVIVISSDEESVCSSRSHSPAPAAQPLTAEQAEEVARRKADFADFLRSNVPSTLIPDNILRYMMREAKARLTKAQEAGVQLSKLSIGEDCLLTWPGLNWDPEAETLHVNIQNRLIDRQVSQDLGDLVRKELISKGNQNLERARDLGIGTLQLSIGASLLPVWNTEQDPIDNVGSVFIEHDDVADERDSMTPQTDAWSVGVPSVMSAITPLTDTFDLKSLDVPQSAQPRETCASDSNSDGNSDSETSDDEYDDVVSLNNFVSEVPVWDDGDAVNILHDVELLGVSGGASTVDLEVYLVEDDDDNDDPDMPELELAVDREAFEFYFGDDEAIDIEIHNAQLFCLGDIEETQSEADESDSDESDHDESAHNVKAHIPLEPSFEEEIAPPAICAEDQEPISKEDEGDFGSEKDETNDDTNNDDGDHEDRLNIIY